MFQVYILMNYLCILHVKDIIVSHAKLGAC